MCLALQKKFELKPLKFQGSFTAYYNRVIKSSLNLRRLRRLLFLTWVFNLALEFAYVTRMLALLGESHITEIKGKRY